MPAIDFTKVEGLEPVPQGSYEFEVVKATEGESASGNPKIDLQCSILTGPQEGRRVFDTLSWHPNALPFTKRKLQALGYGPEFKGNITAEDLVGKRFVGIITVEQTEGVNPSTGESYEPRNRVTKMTPLGRTRKGLLG